MFFIRALGRLLSLGLILSVAPAAPGVAVRALGAV